MKNSIKKWLLALLVLAALVFAATNSKGQRLYSFSFVDTDIAAVFQALTVTAGVDILPAPNVSHKVSIKVTNKSWQEFLSILCRMYELTWHIEENFVYVEKTKDYEDKLQSDAEKKKSLELLAPLIRRNFKIRHAKASDLMEVLSNMRSKQGSLAIVERNNAIIVYDTEKRLSQMAKTIKELDQETKQIVITAKLAVVDARLERALGTRWTAKMGYGNASVSGALPDRQQYDSRSQGTVTSSPGAPADVATSIAMGVLDNNLGISIDNYLGDASSEVLASPQVSTLDHTEAEIFMGEQVSIRTIDADGNVSNQMIEAGIKLTVTPHVSGDGRIMLELHPENSSYSIDENGQPIISTQEATTKVVVADGETVVIAGLAQNKEEESEVGVPFLKDIPLFGHLFKYSRKAVEKKDLMIFVTPHIMKNQAYNASMDQSTIVQSKDAIVPVEAATSIVEVESIPAAVEAEPVQEKVIEEAPVSEIQDPTTIEAPPAESTFEEEAEEADDGWS